MTKLVVLVLALVVAGSALATIGRRSGSVSPPMYRRLLGLGAVVVVWAAAAVVRGRVRLLVLAAAAGATWVLLRTLFPARADR